MTTPTVVVLAGGRSTRFGADKLAAPLADRTVLDTLLAALPPSWPVLLVGPPRTVCRPVTTVREDPPGGGPLAGIAAAVARLRADGGHDDDVVLVVAGDLPAAGAWAPALVAALAAADPATAAVAARSGAPDGGAAHANPLLAAYRLGPLDATIPGSGHDRPAKLLLRELPHATLDAPGPAGWDVDTRADLRVLIARSQDAPGSDAE